MNQLHNCKLVIIELDIRTQTRAGSATASSIIMHYSCRFHTYPLRETMNWVEKVYKKASDTNY